MSSTPQTSGFQLSVMPQFQGVDPRLFNFGGALAEGLTSGVNTGGKLQDIQLAREAADYAMSQRPMKEQLADIQLQSAGVGLEGQKAARHLADIALPGEEIKAKQPIVLEENTFTDLDENGNLAEYKRQKKQDPTTGEISYAPRIYSKTLKTKAQLESDKALKNAQIESLKSLADSRDNRDPKFEADLVAKRLRQARIDGDPHEISFWEARQARINALPGTLAPGTTFDRGAEKAGLDAGFTKSQIALLGQSQAGLNAIIKMKIFNKMKENNNYPDPVVFTPEEKAAVDAVQNVSEKPVSSVPAAAAPAPAPLAPAAAVPVIAPPASPAGGVKAPSAASIALLKSQPQLAYLFDQKFGAGSAAAYLAK